MNAKEARGIVNTIHKGYRNEIDVKEYQEAKAYLKALNGPEVQALIQTLSNSLIIYRASQNQQELWEGWVDKFHEEVERTLATYKEAVGKPGEGERG